MVKLLPLLLLVSLVYFTNASTTIKSENKEYAGKKLDFYQYSDPITKEREFVFSLIFDANGKSEASPKLNSTSFVYSDFGVYRGMLFIEPDETLVLKLPPSREKSFADQKNPYFSPVSFWFVTEDKKQLNDHISGFTQTTNQLTDQFFNQLYFRQSKEIFDSISFQIDEKFPNTTSKTFNTHKKLTTQLIQVEAFRLKPEKYSALFSSVESDMWLHPAFINLFENTFGGQLGFSAKSINGNEVKEAVNQKNISFLLKYVQNKYQVSGEMADLALLKMLYDGFYSGYFSNASIKELIKHDKFSKSSNHIINKSSHLILERFNHLQKDTRAPVICLNNLDGEKECTDSKKDKFKYIVFADTEMIVCREQLKYLANIEERYQKYLDIYVILRNTDNTKMKEFLTANKIPGVKLIDKEGTYILEYKVRSFPVSFLLDENHTVKLPNAKAPLEGFESQFGAFLQQELIESQRNNTK